MSNKRIALFDYFEVDHVSFASGFVRSITYHSEYAQIDASGFNASGVDEILSGSRAETVTAEFFMTMASNEVHQVLYPLHRDKTVFPLVWRKNQNASVSATNPELRGNATIPAWDEGATRGEVEVATIVFVTDSTTPLEWYET